MVFAQHDRLSPAAKRLRRMAGAYMADLRSKAGLTQFQVNNALGYEEKTNLVSQIERGISRVPPTDCHTWAKLYGAPLDELARNLLSYYDPFTYAALFGKPAWLDRADAPADLAWQLASILAERRPH